MVTPRLRHTYQSKGRWFYRRNGVHVPLGGNPATDEDANRRYWEAMSGVLKVESSRTIRALIISYKGSPRWPKAERTRADYLRILDYINEAAGHVDSRKPDRPWVIKAQAKNAHRPRHANYVVTMLSLLFEHAIDMGWRKDNPARGVKKLQTGPGYQPWPEWGIRNFREEADGPLRTTFELCLGTGQRIADVLRMRWSDLEDGALSVTQGKTGVPLWVPLTRSLAAHLEAVERRGLTIVQNERGQPMTYTAIAQRMDHIRKRTGTAGYSWHGLRYNAAIELAEAGCSDAEIQAITGHKTLQMVQKYRRQAQQKRLARKAQERRE